MNEKSTEELTKAAQQALEAWQRAKYAQPQQDPVIVRVMQMIEEALTQRVANDNSVAQQALHLEDRLEDMACVWSPSDNRDLVNNAAAELRRLRALTQRPAAQTEREAFEEWWESDGPNTSSPYEAAMSAWEAGRASLPAPQQATPATPEDMKVYDGIAAGYFADTQQATPEPVGEVSDAEILRAVLAAGGARYGDDGRYIDIEVGELYEAVRAILATRPAPGVPEGFALVPVEPTISMLMAGDESRLSMEHPSRASAVWSAMLAAAQAKGGCDEN